MKIRKHSLFFIISISLLALMSIFFFYISSKKRISIEDCKKYGFPILSIETEGNKSIKSKEKYIKADFTLGSISGKCKIRGHGNSTWKTTMTSKKPYLLKLEKEEPLCGMKSSKKWILLANAYDRSMLRNRYAEYISHNVFDAIQWNPSSEYVFLFLNGKFKGLYELTEKIELEKNRLNITDGFIAEYDSHGKRPYTFETKLGKSKVHIRKPDLENKDKYKRFEEKYNEIEEKILALEADPNMALPAELDVRSFVDWYLLSEYSKNYDSSFYNSVYMNYDFSKNKIYMGPLWDHDIAFGNINKEVSYNPRGVYIANSGWYKILLKNEVFNSAVKKRWIQKKQELEASITWLEKEGKRINEAAELTDSVWHILGSSVWPRAPGYKERKTHQSEVDYLVDWCKKRLIYMDSVYGK